MSPVDTTPAGTWRAYAYAARGIPAATVARRVGSPRPPVWRILHGEREPGADLRGRMDFALAVGDRDKHDELPVYVLAGFDGDRLAAVLATSDHRPAVFGSRDLADTVAAVLREHGKVPVWPMPAWSGTIARLAIRGAEADGRKRTDVEPIYLDGGEIEESGRRLGRFIAEHIMSGVLLDELETLYSLPDAAVDSGAA